MFKLGEKLTNEEVKEMINEPYTDGESQLDNEGKLNNLNILITKVFLF